ncbi:protein SMALL AUXIN UP-REGULATED RNA 8-like [Gastrolobium bilobum]|uniref:protein SMALL AUXIN UP-REGULATED RNA 8-like n=1 Tax=Gastrolobium bilobum TaxID=150636 RepID=UPI002AB18705|nr:protein SMALL AUXIN UP-REGULATED RNA 8-like [Gastrolobium bilobum]
MGVSGSKLWKWVGGGGSGSAYNSMEGPLLAPRGYVPIYVGTNEGTCRRFMVHIKALGDADFSQMLGRSAEEYGFRNEGVLRIPFEAQDFEEWLIRRSNQKTKRRVKPT